MKPNPFPGMNPWLEQHWGDVHTSLTTYARDVLQPGLPAGLHARVEEYVSVENEDEDADDDVIRYSPDVRVLERPGSEFESGGVATAVASTTTTFTEPFDRRSRYRTGNQTPRANHRHAIGESSCDLDRVS